MADVEGLLKKIAAPPPERQSQIEDFVDYPITKTQRLAATDRLHATAPHSKAAGIEPITEQKTDAEVDSVRAAARLREPSLGSTHNRTRNVVTR